jgi:ankyrin repeat protein
MSPPYVSHNVLLGIAHHMREDGGALRYNDYNSLVKVDCTLYHYLNPNLWKHALKSDVDTQRVFTYLITNNNLTGLELFLDLGADPEIRLTAIEITGLLEYELDDIYWGFHPTPMHIAADSDNVPLARLLLKKGAKVQYFMENGHGKYSPLHAARSAEMVQLLLDHNANPELIDDSGERPLHRFAFRGFVAAMKAILHHGAEVNGLDNCSALYLAVLGNNLAAIELLVQHHAVVNGSNPNGETALHAAAKEGNLDVVKLLVSQWPEGVKQADVCLNTPLHDAAMMGYTEVVKFLVELWPQGISARDSQLNTPLHKAARKGKTDVVKFLVEQWPEGMRERNHQSKTPLHLAVYPPALVLSPGMTTEVVKILVERWPEGMKEIDSSGNTPLGLAMMGGDVMADVVQLLWEREWAYFYVHGSVAL